MQKEDKSISLFNYVAESEHNGLNMTCKAYNNKMRFDTVEDSVPIVVHCEKAIYVSRGIFFKSFRF